MDIQAITTTFTAMSDAELLHAAEQVYTLLQLEGHKTADGKALRDLEGALIGERVKRGLLPPVFAKLMKVD